VPIRNVASSDASVKHTELYNGRKRSPKSTGGDPGTSEGCRDAYRTVNQWKRGTLEMEFVYLGAFGGGYLLILLSR
jgi:hypothetical protein